MIKIRNTYGEITLKPTIFPDGTSQIWKIDPREFLYNREYHITWNFESEREIFDLYSFKALLAQPEELRYVTLHIPYLPFARQDKPVSNESTFNLEVLANLINGLNFNKVTSVDVHNPNRTYNLIRNFQNIQVPGAREQAIYDFRPTFIVFPDNGAMGRYGEELSHINVIFGDKVRDQYTGDIVDLQLRSVGKPPTIDQDSRFLIVDDICDGGATFIKVAEKLGNTCPGVKVGLFVTHGIFSKGRQHLLDNGIDKIYTTNSLLKNEDGHEV